MKKEEMLKIEITKCIKYLQENSDYIFRTGDLKLHDASWTASELQYSDRFEYLKSFDFYDLFYDFCQDLYNNFKFIENVEIGKTKRDYIRRTSSFRIINSEYKINETNIPDFMNKIFDVLGYYDFELNENYEFNYNVNLDDFSFYDPSEIFNKINDCCEPVISMWKYIDDIKNNQVRLFEDYLDMLNDDAEDEYINELCIIDETF